MNGKTLFHIRVVVGYICERLYTYYRVNFEPSVLFCFHLVSNGQFY